MKQFVQISQWNQLLLLMGNGKIISLLHCRLSLSGRTHHQSFHKDAQEGGLRLNYTRTKIYSQCKIFYPSIHKKQSYTSHESTGSRIKAPDLLFLCLKSQVYLTVSEFKMGEEKPTKIKTEGKRKGLRAMKQYHSAKQAVQFGPNNDAQDMMLKSWQAFCPFCNTDILELKGVQMRWQGSISRDFDCLQMTEPSKLTFLGIIAKGEYPTRENLIILDLKRWVSLIGSFQQAYTPVFVLFGLQQMRLSLQESQSVGIKLPALNFQN